MHLIYQILNSLAIGYIVWRVGRKKIYPWLDKRLDKVDQSLKDVRREIFKEHYMCRVFGLGHASKSVVSCEEGKCATI